MTHLASVFGTDPMGLIFLGIVFLAGAGALYHLGYLTWWSLWRDLTIEDLPICREIMKTVGREEFNRAMRASGESAL